MTPTLRSKVASALSFAHLAGLGQRSKAEGDDPEKKDEEEAKGSRAEGDDQSDEKEKDGVDSKKSKAEKGDDDKDYADDDEPEKKDEDSGAKGSKADSDDKGKDADAEDDDDEEEMSGKSAAANARRRERARCAAIFGSKAAGRNPVLAANLAFNTRMTRKEAIAVLESTPAAVQHGTDRSARNPSLGSGASAQPNSKQAVAASWDQAFATVPGHTRRS